MAFKRSVFTPARGALHAFLTLLLVTYFVVGVARLGKPELYPFASWGMFSTVPNELTVYRLKLLRVKGSELVRPLYYEESRDVLGRKPKVSTTMGINRWGRALVNGDVATAAALRNLTESTCLPADTEYELVEQRYWPLERFRTGRFDERTLVHLRKGS